MVTIIGVLRWLSITYNPVRGIAAYIIYYLPKKKHYKKLQNKIHAEKETEK